MNVITHFNSQEGEQIALETPIDPYDVPRKNVRGVEEWLSEMEKAMKCTLFAIFNRCA